MEDVVERMNRDITVGDVRGNTFKVSYERRESRHGDARDAAFGAALHQ